MIRSAAVLVRWALLAPPALAASLSAQEVVIDFDDPCGLAALSERARDGTIVEAARFTWVTGRNVPGSFYQEDGMKFLEGVVPPDPALGPIPQPEYHLGYENPRLNDPLVMTRIPNPENEPRLLAPHTRGATIQLTYDPDGDGVPDPFDLLRVGVRNGALNVGARTRRGAISVYNNLTEGFTWGLIDANNLIRATLELPPTGIATHAAGFVIDHIVFRPRTLQPPPCVRPSAGASLAAEDPSGGGGPLFVDPPPLHLYFSDDGPAPIVDVKPRDELNRIDTAAESLLRVALETVRGFDATNVDPASLRLEPGGAAPRQSRLVDTDDDGDLDLLLVFLLAEVELACGDAFLSLSGQTVRGRPFVGQDAVQLTGCVDRSRP
jgi:hypothetical protein